MPGATILEIPQCEQEGMRAELRRARYGSLLALPVLLLCAAGRTPTESATCLFCSRSSVYGLVNASKAHLLAAPCDPPTPKASWRSPSVRRSLRAVLKKGPAAYGWCRTRWRCATLAAQLTLQRGSAVSASTRRRWRHARGWGWKRAQGVARDADPQRIAKLARSRPVRQTLGKRAVGRFAAELDLPLLPKVGSQWMPQGETVKLVTPGQNQKHDRAGAVEPKTGRIVHCTRPRQTNGLFRALLDRLEWLYPKAQCARVYVVVDNYGIHKAQAVEQGLAAQPRFAVRFLPTYGPKANPLERAFGDVHDKCTRNHQRKRLADLVWDVEPHFSTNGPWKYKLSQLYYTPQVTAAVERITTEQQLQEAA